MVQPMQTCELCGQMEVVKPDGRGFPPDIAKRRLQKRCKANGCPCLPMYSAGYNAAIAAILKRIEEENA